jgi:PAS domain S-box-containing protein
VIRDFFNRRRLEESFAISTALLVFVLIGAVMLVVHSRVAEALRRALEARGASIVQSIGATSANALLAYNYAALQAAAEGAYEDSSVVYVAIHDKEGSVAGAAGLRPAPERKLADLPPGEPARFHVRVDDGNGGAQSVLEVAAPVRIGPDGQVWGLVRIGLSFAPVAAELRRLDLGLTVLGLALALAAIAAGRWVARRITAPLRRLAEGTEALSKGDMSHRIPVSGARELADLARAFNGMMDRLQEKARESKSFQQALESLNATLEEQVHERTRALQESEAQYKTLVEHSPDAILIVQAGRVRFVNRAFEEVFGLSPEDALAPDFQLDRIFDPWSATLASARIGAWERGEASSPMEVVGRDSAGAHRDLELRGSKIEYRGSPAAECLLIDMTEAKRLRERLGETEKLRALGELAGGVAHDFNNLLGAILGRVQLLQRKPFDSATQQELTVIERAAQDGRETVRRIQEFSRTRRDRHAIPVEIGDAMRDAVEITKTRWKTDAERRNVAVQVSVDTPRVPRVMGNASELREVFTNLILNAVDAMPQGGSIHLSCWEDGNKVLAEVRDTGVGMTEDTRRHLFDPFFTTKGSRGNGLGLSVVYGIVTRHGGRIDVATALGTGTTFLLEFPSMQGAVLVPVAGDGASMPATLLRPGRILVIDDEMEIADVLRDALVAEGHSVETALTGTDGVRLASASRYDLVFTDLGMPDMTGWEVADRIRNEDPKVPVVLVTGWGASLDEEEVRRRGISAVVHKPFEIDDLVRTAASVLGKGRNAS